MDQEKLDRLMKIGADAFDSLREMTRPLIEDCWEITFQETDAPGKVTEIVDEERKDEFEEAFPESFEVLRDPDEMREAAQEAVAQDALSVELTGTWALGSDPQADGYIILLATGGPAVRIVGDLDANNEPRSASLEVQDWFTSWTTVPCDEGVLMAYVGCFGIGEFAT